MPQSNEDWSATVLYPLLAFPDDQTALDITDQRVVLLSADVDRVQDYVFESARLPEIRGASMLVDELNRQGASTWHPSLETVGDLFAAEGLSPKAIIYSAGGSLLAILPDRPTAERIKAGITELFPRQTGWVTTTCVIHETTVGELLRGYGDADISPAEIWALRQEFPSDWPRIAKAYGLDVESDQKAFLQAVDKESCFGQMVEFMSTLLRCEKDQRHIPLFYETLPHSQRCRSCGRRPANIVGQYGTEELWPLCQPCALKLADRSARRSAWLSAADGTLSLADRYYGNLVPGEVKTANDLTEIGQLCHSRTGYVGFIYADGDNIGRYMQSQRTPGDYVRASQELIQATRRAVYEALANYLQPEQVERANEKDGSAEKALIHPFEIITIGGDDVLLIVPADVALPIAVNICQLFSEALQEKALTMSAGVVLGHAHTPVRALRDIAKQLLRSAKRRARDVSTGDRKQGGLDFLVLASQSMLRRDVDDLRQTRPIKLPGEGRAARLRLTGAPYALDELVKLLHALRLMRRQGFPASQLHQLVAALRTGRERGSLFFLYQQARLRNRPYGMILKDIEKSWGFDPKDPVPWQQVRKEPPDPDPDVGYFSILPDLLDLFGFVPADEAFLTRWDAIIKESYDEDSG